MTTVVCGPRAKNISVVSFICQHLFEGEGLQHFFFSFLHHPLFRFDKEFCGFIVEEECFKRVNGFFFSIISSVTEQRFWFKMTMNNYPNIFFAKPNLYAKKTYRRQLNSAMHCKTIYRLCRPCLGVVGTTA